MSAATEATRNSYERVIDALHQSGARCNTTGRHTQATCPVPSHEDRSPSLSIDYKPDARKPITTVHCQTGCDVADVLAALGLALTDLYDEAPTRPPAGQTRQPRAPRSARPAAQPAAPAGPECLGKFRTHRHTETTRYPYTDPDGTVLGYRVRRQCTRPGCTGKTFGWLRVEGNRTVAGGLSRAPLYRLPDALAAIAEGRAVYVTEGEKDADAVTEAGGAACTMGAADTGRGSSWKAWHTEALAGAREVIICADRDVPGRRSAAYIAAQLTAAGVPTVRTVEAIDGKDVADHLAAGHPLTELRGINFADADDNTAGHSVGPGSTSRESADVEPEDQGDDQADNVVPLRGGAAPKPDPGPRVPMSAGQWTYSTGGPDYARGVWQRPTANAPWARVAPLPYVRARIVRRSPNGTPAGLDYLISATDDGPGVIVGALKLRDGSWANELGLSLSDDDKIVRAASTAIKELAERDADLREAVPRADDSGRIGTPVPESLPDGYLRTSPATPTEARRALAEIIRAVAEAPTLALVMGGSAIAPFVKPLHRQSHVVHLHSPEGGTGKTTCAQLGAGIWGDPFTRGTGVLRSWNATATGIGRHLGQLGILPVFLDESGMARWAPGDWGQVLFELTEGNDRLLAEAKGSGTRIGSPWGGMVLSTGNARLTAAVSATRFGGVFRRVIELGTPFTHDADHAEHLAALMRTAWGHPGGAILKHYTTTDVAARIERAEQLIGLPSDGPARTVARHVAGHVAGASILDELAGTGRTLTDAAITAARTILDRWAPPPGLADRAIAAIRDSLASHPAAWPTVAEYRETLQTRAEYGQNTPASILPTHGIERQLNGVRADDDTWVAAFTKPWEALCAAAELDSADTLAELHTTGALIVPTAALKAGEWQASVRLKPKPARADRMYKFALPELESDDDTENQAPAGGVPGRVPGRVPGEVPAANPPLTCGVPEVPGPTGKGSRTREGCCPTCGEPVADSARGLFDGYHPLCAPEDPGQGAAPTQTPGTCPGCGGTVPENLRAVFKGWHMAHAPADVRAAGLAAMEASRTLQEPQTGREGHRDARRAIGAGRAAGAAQAVAVADQGALADLDQQVTDIRRALRRVEIEVTEAEARDVLTAWHKATGGLRFLGWAGHVGLAAYARHVARSGADARGVPTIDSRVMPDVEEASSGLALHLDWLAPDVTLSAGQVVTELDVNGQFLAAAAVELGNGEPESLDGAPRDLATLKGRPGYVRLAEPLAVPAGVLPTTGAAWDGIEAGCWLGMASAQYLHRVGVPVHVDRVLWWAESRRHLDAWQREWRTARERLMATPGRPAALALVVLKGVVTTTLGGLLRSGRTAERYCRRDWSDAVITEAWVRALVAVEKAGRSGAVVLGMRRDSAWFRTPADSDPGPITPPGLTVSGQLGKWKHSRWAEATDRMVEAHDTGSPETFNSATKAAHEARKAGQE